MKKKAKLIGYIIGILVFISTIAGFTYAMYRKSLYNVNVSGELKNLNEYVVYSKGVNISSGTLNPVDSYTEGNSATITFYKRESPYDIYGHIYLDINAMSAGVSHELKYTIVDNSSSNIISEGSFYTYTTGSSLLAAANIPLNTTETTYTIYVWVDEALYDINTGNSGINIDIRCYATMKTISNDYVNATVPNVDSAANYIKYMYDSHSKNVVTNNNIAYNYSPAVNLMNDRHASMDTDINGGNIRYYGVAPNNYVYFNCSDYSNQSSSTCELWRIIGVFEDKVKIIRNTEIGHYSWDTSSATINSGKGINEWTQADLMKLLNSNFDDNVDLDKDGNNISVNNSLYWNSGSGNCYKSINNATTTCDFTSIGLKNEQTKSKIADVTWYLGGVSNPQYANVTYKQERENTHVNNPSDGVARQDTWNGKIALAYLSDYEYASDFTKCIYSFTNATSSYICRINNWFSPSSHSLTSSSSGVTQVWYYNNTDSGGSIAWIYAAVRTEGVEIGYGSLILPSLYLKSTELIFFGTGTKTDPYRLSN